MTFHVEHTTGPAGEHHARPWPEPLERTVWLHDVDGPALVLGSTQPDDVVDATRAAARSVDVVRRASGGGAVLVEPGALVWADVFLPAGDPLWDDDVGRSFHWLGGVWVDALARVGVLDAATHEGALVATEWSPLVCFAGLGPGEVTIGGAKVVGMAQRRTRSGCRFQCAALVAPWDPAALLDLLALDDARRGEGRRALASAARDAGVDAGALAGALVRSLG